MVLLDCPAEAVDAKSLYERMRFEQRSYGMRKGLGRDDTIADNILYALSGIQVPLGFREASAQEKERLRLPN